MIAEEFIALLGYDLEGEGDLRRFRAGLASVRTSLRGVATAAAGAGAVIGAAVSAGAAAAGWSITRTNAQFEGFEAQLTTITGSSERAKEAMDWITDFAKTTPFEVAELTRSFSKLKAYGIDPLANDTMSILGDTASAMNKTLDEAVEAFADAATFQFERLREFGITTRQEGDRVTFSYTKNGEQLQQTVEKSGDAVRKFLLENFGDRFAGAMETRARTFDGLASNIADTWTAFQKRIGDAGFFEVAKDQLRGLLEWTERMDANGSLQRWAENISDAMVWATTTSRSMLGHLATQFQTLSEIMGNDTVQTTLKAIGGALGVLFVWLFPVVSGIIAFGLAVDDLITYLGGGESVIGRFIEALRNLKEQALSGFDGEQFRDIGDKLAEWIFDGFKWAVARLFANMSWMLRFIWSGITGTSGESTAIEAGDKLIRWLFDGIKAGVLVYEGLVNGLTERIAGWFKDVDWVQVGKDIATSIFDGIKSLAGMAAEFFNSLRPEWLGGSAPVQRGGNSHSETGGGEDADRATKAFNEASRDVESRSGSAASSSTVSDNSRRTTNNTSNVTVNQTVQSPTDAPGAVAEATGRSASRFSENGSRLQYEGAR